MFGGAAVIRIRDMPKSGHRKAPTAVQDISPRSGNTTLFGGKLSTSDGKGMDKSTYGGKINT